MGARMHNLRRFLAALFQVTCGGLYRDTYERQTVRSPIDDVAH